MNITEDYASFELSKLLKEKGFDSEDCFAFYNEYGEIGFLQTFGDIADYDSETCVIAPTLQMACKFLREVHKLVITVSIGNENNKGNTDYSNPDRWFYFFDITNAKGVVIDTEYDPFSNEFSTYEEAVEAACLYVLKNLI